jgi:putative inorganic carbon (HCO3(-)) transporter
LLGVGVGNYSIKYQDYSRTIGLDSRRVPRTPASLYLEILSEQGLVGIFVFAILIIYVFRRGVRAYNKFKDFGLVEESNILKAFLAGLLGYLIAAATKNSAYANAFWVLIGIAIGAIHLSDSLTKSQPVIDERA